MITTSEDIRAIRPISENLNDTKRLVPYIDECEKLFVIKAIGAKKYVEIETAVIESQKVTDPIELSEEIKSLLDGCFYDDNNQRCEGLRKAVGYLAYSRFVRNQNVNATAFAIVAKKSEFSENVDEKTIVRIANDAEKVGLEYLNQCVDFINYGKNSSEKRIFKGRMKFKSIGN